MIRRRVRRAGPLRVLFIVPSLPPGGAERHVVTLLPAMDPRRFSPSVVCIAAPGELFAQLVDAGVPARWLGRTKRGMLQALASLVVHMWRTRPDVVVVHGFNAEVLGRIAATLTRVPHSVVWVHQCSDIRPRGMVKRWVEAMLRPVTTAYFGVAYAQIPYLTEDLGHPISKVRIIQNGADPDAFPYTPTGQRDDRLVRSLGIRPGEPVVGIVASMRPEKDHATFLRAGRLVLDRIPDARFVLVGRGDELAKTTELAEALGLADRAIFTGMREDVAALLAVFDVVALTSTTVECFPMSVLEAMAVGRPTVCTAVGGVPEIVIDGVTGYLVPPSDPVTLADRLVELLDNPTHAQAMGKAGRARLETEFSLDRSVREAERRIEEIAGRRQHP